MPKWTFEETLALHESVWSDMEKSVPDCRREWFEKIAQTGWTVKEFKMKIVCKNFEAYFGAGKNAEATG